MLDSKEKSFLFYGCSAVNRNQLLHLLLKLMIGESFFQSITENRKLFDLNLMSPLRSSFGKDFPSHESP